MATRKTSTLWCNGQPVWLSTKNTGKWPFLVNRTRFVQSVYRNCPRPTLFPDIHQWPATSKARLFADCLLYSTITTEDDASHLQMDLENLQWWETDWLVHFNHNNCEVIRITTKGRQRTTPTTFKGQGFAIITQVKYLGVNISNKLSWNHHIKSVCKYVNNTAAF